MEWTNETSLALIEEYRSHPELWHTRHGHYYSKKKKQRAWEAIADNLGLGVDDVRQKMNSLTGSFRRERSKMRRGEGRYALGNRTSRWFAFSKMVFLLDRHQDLIDDKMNLEEVNHEEEDKGEEEDKDEEEEEEDDLALDSDSNHLLEEELNQASHDTSSRTRKHKRTVLDPLELPPKKAKIRDSEVSAVQESSLSPDQEECAIYGQYLAKKLMRMSRRTRALVRHSIDNVLFEADLGKYDNTSSPFDNNTLGGQSDGVNLFPELGSVLEVTKSITNT